MQKINYLDHASEACHDGMEPAHFTSLTSLNLSYRATLSQCGVSPLLDTSTHLSQCWTLLVALYAAPQGTSSASSVKPTIPVPRLSYGMIITITDESFHKYTHTCGPGDSGKLGQSALHGTLSMNSAPLWLWASKTQKHMAESFMAYMTKLCMYANKLKKMARVYVSQETHETCPKCRFTALCPATVRHFTCMPGTQQNMARALIHCAVPMKGTPIYL